MNNWHLLLKRKAIALIWEIREDQNLWAVIQFTQLIVTSDTSFSAFFIISLLQNKCQYLFFTHGNWKCLSHQERSNTLFTHRIMEDLHYTNWHIDLQTSTGLRGQDERPLFVHWTHLTHVVYDVWGAAQPNMGGEGHMEWGPPTAQGTSAWEKTCIRHCQPP